MVKVSVYVVVDVGETVTEPPDTGVTLPIPLLIEALVALLLVQLSVVELPNVIVDAPATNVPLGAATTVIVAV